MSSYVSHLESAIDATRLEAGRLHTMHAGRPLWVRYHLDAVAAALTRDMLRERPATMWRYRELLPPERDSSIVSLGEGMTPLLKTERLGAALGIGELWIKDDSQLPTGTFKSRGQSAALSMAREFGIRRVAIPTAGNAGGAMAAYAARAGMEAYVFMPEDTPIINQVEAGLFGAKVFLVNGLINDCAAIVQAGKEHMQWFDISTLKEPYRVEGKKTMGLELAEQFDWTLPDVILYPTGGGTGLIGMWKAFRELASLGWLNSGHMPRMVAVQSEGCCPVVRAFDEGMRFAEFFEGAHTIASGIRVPGLVGDFMVLDTLRVSEGCAVAVPEGQIRSWMRMGAALEGIALCPESACCIGAAEQLRASGWIRPADRVVLYNCGAAQKYPSVLQSPLPRIDRHAAIDWAWIESGG